MPEITPGVVGDWQLEVAAYLDGTEPTTWTRVGGLKEFNPPSTEKGLEDDSSADSDGWLSEIATSLKWTASGTVKVARKGLPQDPGQAILEAAASEILEDGFVHVRVTNKTAPTKAKQGIADAQFKDNGGPFTDATSAEFTLTGRGKLAPVTITP